VISPAARNDEDTWEEDAKLLTATIEELETRHWVKTTASKGWLRLYYRKPTIDGPLLAWPDNELAQWDQMGTLGFNLTAEIVDASAATICQPLRADVQPIGGDEKQRKAARLNSTFLHGVMEANHALDVFTRVYKDGCAIEGLGGCVKWFVDEETKEIRCERLNGLQVLYDGESDDPDALYYYDAVPRKKLIERFPDKEDEIERLAVWRPTKIVGVDSFAAYNDADTVKVCEAWSKGTRKKPGKHVISCGELVLVEEPWKMRIPVEHFQWSSGFRGLTGVPLISRLAPYDVWINSLVYQVRDSLQFAMPIFLSREDADLRGLNDMIPGQVVEYAGMDGAVTVTTPETVAQSVVNWIESLRERAYGEAGVSPQMSAGQKPAGLNSEPAINAYVDLVSVRLRIQQKNWERLWQGSAEIIMELADLTYADDKPARVKAPGTELLEQIPWKSYRLPEDKYVVGFGLQSALSLTVAGRLEDTKALQDLGLAGPADVARMLQMPDTQALSDELNAPLDLIHAQIDSCLEDGVIIPPTDTQDLQLAIAKASAAHQGAKAKNASGKAKFSARNIETLRRFIQMCRQKAAPPPAPAAPPPAPGPAPAAGAGSPPAGA